MGKVSVLHGNCKILTHSSQILVLDILGDGVGVSRCIFMVKEHFFLHLLGLFFCNSAQNFGTAELSDSFALLQVGDVDETL